MKKSIELHHLIEGPDDAPVLVLSNSLGTTLEMWRCEVISGADLAGRLGAIRAPTLIIAGAEDPAAPPERSESIRDAVPDARLEILSPAAHLADVERPEATTGTILEHLQAVVTEET